MNNFVLDFKNEKVKVKSEWMGDELWIHARGETFCYKPDSEARRESSNLSDGNGEIKAPMPGKIIKVNREAGDRVEATEVIIVMEAMKMEYSLKAGRGGVLVKLNCRPGDQVELGRLLAVVK